MIVEGDVDEVLLDGLAYWLAVDEIFKGQATGATVRIGPTSRPAVRGCEIGLSLSGDDHVILCVVDVTGGLNSLPPPPGSSLRMAAARALARYGRWQSMSRNSANIAPGKGTSSSARGVLRS